MEKKFFTALKDRNDRYNILLLIFFLTVIYSFVFGDSGLLQKTQLMEKKKEINSRITDLIDENKTLTQKYDNILNKGYDHIYKEEALKSGYVNTNEKYLYFKDKDGVNARLTDVSKSKQDKNKIELSHLRILWIVVSVMIILIYIIKSNKASAEEF